jgi:hypothetical protein
MKVVCAVMLLALLGPTVHAAVKANPFHYLLLYPSSTIETDVGGGCVVVTNVGQALVYLPTASVADWLDALKTMKTEVKVSECAAR